MTGWIRDRQLQEDQERQSLAGYAMKAGESRGREHAEPEHEYRTCYQRDRDRVIHSASFRRLEAKTQVFLDTSSDYYRTRLTHTIEVAQIARTLARCLSVNEDLAEAVALAHDLGHPPYGHCGEAVLNELMAGEGGFEHNRHSLRVVEYLEHPYPSFRGLNLTVETRECLAKHESRFDLPGRMAEYGDGYGPLEGQIADLADAIAYNSHDLDDALACGLLHEEDLKSVDLYQRLHEKIQSQFPEAHRHVRQLRCAKAMIDLLFQDTLEQTAERLKTYQPKTVDEVRGCEVKLVSVGEETGKQMRGLEEFLLARVYYHRRVVDASRIAKEQLRYLFARFKKEPSLLPERYQRRLGEQDVHRVVCDYMAGMTDRFCQRQYDELIGRK